MRLNNWWVLRAEAADGATGADTGGAAAGAVDVGTGGTDTGGGSSGNVWDEFIEEPVVEGEFEVDAPKAEAPKPAVQAPAAPAAPVAPTPIAGEVKPEAQNPAAPPVTPAAQTETPTPTPTPAAQPQQTFDWDKWEADSVAKLTPDYEMSSDEVAQFLTEPEAVLPVLAARVHTAVVRNVLAQMENMMQQYVPVIMQQQTKRAESENTFYSLNDDLKDAKFVPQIQASIQQFRSINPSADVKTIALKVGNMVRLMNGMQLRPEVGDAQQAQQTPPTPTKPFTPATAGAVGGATTTNSNPFADLAESFLRDE